jgi:hypothetical protein
MKYIWMFPYYLGWHYGRGLLEMFIIFRDFLFFVPRFFSIGELFRTLLSPFQRLKEHRSGGLDIGDALGVFTINIMMRLVGLIVRSFVIALGIISFVLTFFLEIFLFILWLVLPFLLIFLFFASLISIFTN